MTNIPNRILKDDEKCKYSGCAIGNKVIPNPCSHADKRGCTLFAVAGLSATHQYSQDELYRKAELSELFDVLFAEWQDLRSCEADDQMERFIKFIESKKQSYLREE